MIEIAERLRAWAAEIERDQGRPTDRGDADLLKEAARTLEAAFDELTRLRELVRDAEP
jgi:hypothetical protein